LFVPKGWWHATLNIGETVAVVQVEGDDKALMKRDAGLS